MEMVVEEIFIISIPVSISTRCKRKSSFSSEDSLCAAMIFNLFYIVTNSRSPGGGRIGKLLQCTQVMHCIQIITLYVNSWLFLLQKRSRSRMKNNGNTMKEKWFKEIF